jgi:hypothetical protein
VPTDNSLCCGIEGLTRRPGFSHHQVAADLSHLDPAGFREGLHGLLARDAREPSHASVPTFQIVSLASDCDHNLPCIGGCGPALNHFLIFGPQPCLDGFADILERLFLVPALRDASRKSGALSHNPAIFSFLESYVKQHMAQSIA